jgi:G:T-mismatch repair DNA endonuclease (very short patch repair protein)
MKANKKKPNRKELELGSLLQKWLFKEYKYVGDGQFILGGLCPDFLNVNGQKKVIEMFGDYWHREEDVQKRIGRFKEYGYNCLVVWERELKDISLVKKKVLKFNGKRKGD